MVLFTLLATMFLGLVIVASAWERDNRASLEDYAIYVSQRERVPIPLVLKILKCESGFNPTAWNKSDPHGGAKGIAQFLEPTFRNFSRVYDIHAPDIWNPFQQINLLVYMVKDGLERHWTCAR